MTEANDRSTTIPIVEEVASVAKREVEIERIRVRTQVEERTHDLTMQLERAEMQVERRVVERVVASAPEPYEEGELLIIPITEERAVVVKQLFVVEEIVVRRVAHSEEAHFPTTLRKMRAVVERDDRD